MNPLVRKLEHGARLTDEDRAMLERITIDIQSWPARTDIISEGDEPHDVHILMEGYACRYKILPDGKRQIMALFVPGDFCDLHVHILGQMDHGIATLTDARVVDISPETVAELTANPRINRAFWWATLVDEGTLREWLVNMGQRDAARQMAHIFCELYIRLASVGRAQGSHFELLRQNDLADLMGITPVHVSRTLTKLRDDGLVDIDDKHLIIPDLGRLKRFCDFNSNYLHLRDAEVPRSAHDERVIDSGAAVST